MDNRTRPVPGKRWLLGLSAILFLSTASADVSGVQFDSPAPNAVVTDALSISVRIVSDYPVVAVDATVEAHSPHLVAPTAGSST